MTLVQAWVATDKLEWIVEKAVELGVAAIILVPTVRSVVQLDGPRLRTPAAAPAGDRRGGLLPDAAATACPASAQPSPCEQGLELALRGRRARLLLDPHAAERCWRRAVGRASPLALAVGPEGGFDDDERALAARLGYRPMRLGPRILRTETAGLAGPRRPAGAGRRPAVARRRAARTRQVLSIPTTMRRSMGLLDSLLSGADAGLRPDGGRAAAANPLLQIALQMLAGQGNGSAGCRR